MSKTKLTVGLAAGGLAIVGAGALGVAMKDATSSKPANADTEHVTSTSTSTAKSETAKATSEAPTTAKASVATEASEHAVQGQVLAENRERLDAVLEDVSAVVGAREAEVSNALANTTDNTSVISAMATTGSQPATAVLEPTVVKSTVNATAQGAVAPGGVALKPETEAAIAIVSETLDNHSEAHSETSETTQVTDAHSEVATDTHSEASTTTASSEAPVETPASEMASTEAVAPTSEVKTEDHSQASETVAPTSEAPTTVETSEAQAPVITVSEAPTYEAPATTPIEAVQPETYDAPVTETTAEVEMPAETPAPVSTPTASAEATPNTYPTGQCTWGVKEMAPWVGNYWGNARDWIASAQNAGYSTGSNPTVGSVAVWPEDGGGYGHVAYVTSVTNNNSIQVMESNYAGNMSIGNYRGEFDPTNTYSGSSVSYIYPN